jgi:hypothetical protein
MERALYSPFAVLFMMADSQRESSHFMKLATDRFGMLNPSGTTVLTV